MNTDEACAIVIGGANGSGKSTLLQVLSTARHPSKGVVSYQDENGIIIPAEKIFHLLSFAAPYLELIEECTLLEFLQYHFTFKPARMKVNDMIARIGLGAAAHKQILSFSSGMKQRVKLAQAILADTPVLMLDEPCTNLDEDGVRLYQELIEEHTGHRLVLVASNDKREYSFCTQHIRMRDGVVQSGSSF